MPWLYKTPLTRRQLLRSAVIGAAMMAAPRWARAITPTIITETVEFEAGQTYEDKFYICDPAFDDDNSVAAAAKFTGSGGQTLRRVVLDSGFRHWQSRWDTFPEVGPPPGIRSSVSGMTSQGPSSLTLEGVEIRGFPQFGLFIYGCSDSTFTEIGRAHV